MYYNFLGIILIIIITKIVEIQHVTWSVLIERLTLPNFLSILGLWLNKTSMTNKKLSINKNLNNQPIRFAVVQICIHLTQSDTSVYYHQMELMFWHTGEKKLKEASADISS